MLGRLSADSLHRPIGATIRLRGSNGSETFHVVGIGVVPGIGGVDGVGEGGIVTPTGFARVNGASETNGAALSLRSRATIATVRRLAARIGSEVLPGGGESIPPSISNVERVRRIPAALAVLLGVLALMSMLHALYMSARSRRVDVAIMKSLGANRRWITRLMHAQATMLTLIPLVDRTAARRPRRRPALPHLRRPNRRDSGCHDPDRRAYCDRTRRAAARQLRRAVPRARRASPPDRSAPARRVARSPSLSRSDRAARRAQ